MTQPDLVKAGLNPNVDPALLHLYAEANEQPIEITGASAGPGGFGPQAAINFYGTGIDTPYSGTRVYWLAAESDAPGARIQQLQPSYRLEPATGRLPVHRRVEAAHHLFRRADHTQWQQFLRTADFLDPC